MQTHFETEYYQHNQYPSSFHLSVASMVNQNRKRKQCNEPLKSQSKYSTCTWKKKKYMFEQDICF